MGDGDSGRVGAPNGEMAKVMKRWEAQRRSAEGDHTLLLEIMPGPTDDTAFRAPFPRRCSLCGVYEPIVSLVREGDTDPCVSYGGPAEAAVCADSRECIRRRLHDVGGRRL